MFWLSLAVSSLMCLCVGSIFYFFIERKKIREKTARWLTVAAALITLVGMQFYGAQLYLGYVFESKIKSEDPIFALLAQKSPLDFKQYIAKIKNDFITEDGNKVPFYTGEYIYSQLKKYSPHATTQSFYDLAKATADLYTKIYAHNPDLVLTIEFNLQEIQPLNFSAMSNTLSQAFYPVTSAKIMIIKAAINNPQPELSAADKERAQAIIQNIMRKLSVNYGSNVVADTFNHPNNPTLDHKIAAEVIIQFYQMLLNRGKEDAGLVAKYIFTASI